jgi:hypothetical protein
MLDRKPFKYVECKKCTYVHFETPLQYAEEEVQSFNRYYENLPEEGRSIFGGPASLDTYKSCMGCGGSYRNFRAMPPERYPEIYGHTINPILAKESKNAKKPKRN